ncbi:MAG TPA: LLM class F420-dependent oxidoreductase [Solirubrobacteraceae bacterium]|nr:LLM class F420-dependent oxidoreductase [Solirubrobacteraceae bacterium]
MRAPITLDLHLPNFNYPNTGPDQLFETLVGIARTAEGSGFSSISLMDHLHQIRGVGPETNWMFEGSTMLAGLAARTSKATLGLIVGGVPYRNPALHAKITTTLDVISGGRAWHGIGAAWFEGEARAYGFEFPPLGQRFELLEEAVQIARAMFTQERATFHGDHFRVEGALNNPKPVRGDIPIVIGGSGERKTLRLVAQYADGCNLFGDVERCRHLLGVLEDHCERLGRDPAEITKTRMGVLVVGDTHERAMAKVAHVPEDRRAFVLAGDADEVAEQGRAFAEVGIDGLTVSIPDVHDLETVELAGRALGPVFASASA